MQPTWLKRFTNYLLTHRIQALAITFASAFIPILGLLSILIAGLMTLMRGGREGAIFTAAATLPFFVGLFNPSFSYPLAYWASVGVAVLSNVLTWVFAVLLYRKTSWAVIIQVAALLGVLVISVIHLIFPDITTWWQTQLQFYYEHSLAAGKLLNVPAVNSGENQLEVIQLTKQYASGLIAAAILFNAVLQLIIARWWQFRILKAHALYKELHYIQLSKLAGILFIFSLWLAYLRNSVVLDIMPILYLLFTAAGLSLIHFLFGLMKSSTRWFWLCILYLTLLFTIPMSMMLVSMLALFDSWFDIRKRVVKV